MSLVAMFTVIIAVCSWISVPSAVPFTLQTFGVFASVGILGGKRGSLAVLIYILLGAIGVPVFSGFSGGLGYLFGATGGFIIGFLFASLAMWAAEGFLKSKRFGNIISSALGLIICYAFGTAWFMLVFTKKSGEIGFVTALSACVLPYIIPDVIKIILANGISLKIRKAKITM